MSTFPYIDPIFQPAMRQIAAITQSNPAIVTTTQNHLYKSGNIIRLDIPANFGMVQANQQFGTTVVTGPTTFTIAIDTTFYDAYVVPAAYGPAGVCVPFAEDNNLLTNAVQNTLPH